MIKKLNDSMKKDNKGFTLVELIVVMAILAILAALAVPAFNNVLKESRYKSHNANVKMIQEAVEVYYANNGDLSTGDGTTAIDIDDLVSEGLLKEPVPDVPYGGTDKYAVTPDAEDLTTGVYTVTPGTITDFKAGPVNNI